MARAAALAVTNPDATFEELFAAMPGPDFPDGGQVISAPTEIAEAYRTGRGILRARARWRIEDLARGQWRIVVHELPYQVSTKRVLEELDALSNPQPQAGKKALSQQQQNLKQVVLNVLERASDESGQKEKIRLVLEPRTSKVDPAELMAVLFAHTSLESGFSVNCTLLGLDGKPQQKGLAQILGEWAAFRVGTVSRRTGHQLERTTARIHILEGRRIAFLNIDRVIKVIREADEPKADLIAAFGLTPVQADDILEIRLRQLARLEGIRIEQELAELTAERKRLAGLLASDKALRRLIVREIEADAAKFGDARRTLLEPAARVVAANAAILVPDEPVTIVISKNGWIRARPGHGIDLSTLSFKAGDSLGTVVETRTTRPVAVLDSKGRAYSIDAADVPTARGDGVPITSLVDLQDGAKARCILSAADDARYLFANSGGYGYVAPFAALVGRNRAGKAFMTVDDGETVLAPAPLAGGWQRSLPRSAVGRLRGDQRQAPLLRTGRGEGAGQGPRRDADATRPRREARLGRTLPRCADAAGRRPRQGAVADGEGRGTRQARRPPCAQGIAAAEEGAAGRLRVAIASGGGPARTGLQRFPPDWTRESGHRPSRAPAGDWRLEPTLTQLPRRTHETRNWADTKSTRVGQHRTCV